MITLIIKKKQFDLTSSQAKKLGCNMKVFIQKFNTLVQTNQTLINEVNQSRKLNSQILKRIIRIQDRLQIQNGILNEKNNQEKRFNKRQDIDINQYMDEEISQRKDYKKRKMQNKQQFKHQCKKQNLTDKNAQEYFFRANFQQKRDHQLQLQKIQKLGRKIKESIIKNNFALRQANNSVIQPRQNNDIQEEDDQKDLNINVQRKRKKKTQKEKILQKYYKKQISQTMAKRKLRISAQALEEMISNYRIQNESIQKNK